VLSRLHKTLGGWGTAQTPVESIQHSSSPLQLLQQLPAELFIYHLSFIPLGLRTGTYSGDGGGRTGRALSKLSKDRFWYTLARFAREQ